MRVSTEQEKIEGLRKGNVNDFEDLFNKYANRIYSFGIKYLKSKEDAEELVQNVFLKIWEKKDHLKTEGSFQSFLFNIAYHNICNTFRKRLNQRIYLEHLSEDTFIDKPADDNIDYKNTLEQVEQLVSKLPENQRLAFQKSKNEGLSSKEIAKELNISSGTVDNYISSTLKYLSKKLGKNSLYIILFLIIFY